VKTTDAAASVASNVATAMLTFFFQILVFAKNIQKRCGQRCLSLSLC